MWSSWSPQGMGGGWSEVVRETHWSEMISGLGWGSGFLSLFIFGLVTLQLKLLQLRTAYQSII